MSENMKTVKIVLKGLLTVNDAEQLHKHLMGKLKENDSIVIDFSELEDLDVSIIQLICALYLECKKQKKEFSIKGAFHADVKNFLFYSGFISNKTNPDDVIISEFMQKMGIIA